MAVLPGGLSAPALTLVTTQSSPTCSEKSLLLVVCCAHPYANFSRGQKDLPRTKLSVRLHDMKTTEPPVP